MSRGIRCLYIICMLYLYEHLSLLVGIPGMFDPTLAFQHLPCHFHWIRIWLGYSLTILMTDRCINFNICCRLFFFNKKNLSEVDQFRMTWSLRWKCWYRIKCAGHGFVTVTADQVAHTMVSLNEFRAIHNRSRILVVKQRDTMVVTGPGYWLTILRSDPSCPVPSDKEAWFDLGRGIRSVIHECTNNGHQVKFKRHESSA